MMEKYNLIPKILLKRIADGDHAAFRSFYDVVYPAVYQFARCFLTDGEDCKEVVSEVFYAIWKHKETLAEVENLKSWLFIVCRNEAYHFLKQKERYSFVSIDDMPVELQIDTADADFMDEEMLEIYRNAVKTLPERCKLIFMMVKEEHLKYKEIAEILSIAEGTVAQQMNIAIHKITNIVRQQYAESKHKI
jgi:RNA polymerase sigma-70 factor (ECF subfamily)